MAMLETLRNRLQAMEPRERMMLIVGIIAVVITVLYLAVIEPLANYRAQLESGVQARRELVSWMRGASSAIRARGPAAAPAPASDGSLLAMADSSARAAGMSGALRRIQQDGSDAVRMRFEGASFDTMIGWLDGLEKRHGIAVREMTVDRAEGAGLVNASLTLERKGS